jgi:hypothetical protein
VHSDLTTPTCGYVAQAVRPGSSRGEEKHLKYNHLIANAAAIQNVIDPTCAVRALQTDGYVIRRDDLAQLSPYQTRRLKRFGDYTLSLSAPEPFDADLLMPFPLDEQSEAGVVP